MRAETPSKPGEFRESLQETDWAWLAGFIDGEGHVSIRRGYAENKATKRRAGSQDSWVWYAPRLSVHNTYEPAMVIAGAMLDASVHQRKKSGMQNHPVFTVEVTARHKLLRVLPSLTPYMIVKRERAELLLELVSLPRGSEPRKEQIYRRLVTLSQAG